MFNHPDVQSDLVRQRLDEARAEAARRSAQGVHAWPNFVPASRWRDTALWASLVGPLLGGGFLLYFVLEIARAVTA